MIDLDQKYHALMGAAGQRPGGAPAPQLRLCFEVLALAGAIDRDCAARLGAHRLSEGKFVLLFLLQDAPGGLAPRELAERAGVTRATITGLLDGLERDGLVLREPSEADRRQLVVRLTPQGQDTAGAAFGAHTQWIAGLFDGWPPDDMERLSGLLARVWSRTDAARGGPEAAP